jgi:hypothetical protein
MNPSLGEKLQAASVQAVNLVGVLQMDPQELKATHIRKCEKSFFLLEEFLNQETHNSALNWLRTRKAIDVLDLRLQKVSILTTQAAKVEASLQRLQEDLSDFQSLSETKQNQLEKFYHLTVRYLAEKRHFIESATVHRYERFQKLKGLVQYADNATFLCDAIRHFENRDKYEENRKLLVQKQSSALARLQNVRRGFYLAVIFCLLIVTLPICGPFAYSLYRRKKTIEFQIANLGEVLKRETKRIQIADEGVVAAQEIREILGVVSLEQVSQTLTEVGELRREFMSFQPSQSQTAVLVHFFESEDQALRCLFGTPPSEVVERITWFHDNFEVLSEKSANERKWTQQKTEIEQKIIALLGGRSESKVKESLVSLQLQAQQEPYPWIETQSLLDFISAVETLPSTLFSFREFLWKITHGMSIDLLAWKKLGTALGSQANVLSATSLELSLEAPGDQAELFSEEGLQTANASNVALQRSEVF